MFHISGSGLVVQPGRTILTLCFSARAVPARFSSPQILPDPPLEGASVACGFRESSACAIPTLSLVHGEFCSSYWNPDSLHSCHPPLRRDWWEVGSQTPWCSALAPASQCSSLWARGRLSSPHGPRSPKAGSRPFHPKS